MEFMFVVTTSVVIPVKKAVPSHPLIAHVRSNDLLSFPREEGDRLLHSHIRRSLQLPTQQQVYSEIAPVMAPAITRVQRLKSLLQT
jgi:hypothetical protein